MSLLRWDAGLMPVSEVIDIDLFQELDSLAAETCAYMSQVHPDFSTLAARIAVSNLHKNTHESFSETVGGVVL